MPKLIDLTGQKFGRWTVLSKAPSYNKVVYWLCQCECGTIKEVKAQCLREGKSTSCGCYQREKAKIDRLGKSPRNLIDLTGQKFGKLTVIKKSIDHKATNGAALWECQCECGNSMIAEGRNLRNGKTWHCGCEQIFSKGENKIRELFLKANIQFEQGKCFYQKCKYPDTNVTPRFDFWVNNQYIIEYDGQHHFINNINQGWITKEKVQKTQEHDQFKNQWCKENNIPLIRIPYTHYTELCLEDLLLETSKFVIT